MGFMCQIMSNVNRGRKKIGLYNLIIFPVLFYSSHSIIGITDRLHGVLEVKMRFIGKN